MGEHMSIVVFDTETTGLVQPEPIPLEKQPQIIEFAGIKLDKNLKEVDRLEFLVDPGIEIPKLITKITNITTSMTTGQGDFASHLKKLQNFFVGVEEFVAHNLMFDHDMLAIELRRIDKLTQFPWPPIRTCTVEATHHINNYRLNLGKLHKHLFNEEFTGAHRAMVDVEALTRCYIELSNRGIV